MYALQNYRNCARVRWYAFNNTVRDESSTFDDRGVVYIRQGPPDRTATYISESLPSNESWLYFRPGGNLVLNFAAEGSSGWKLIDGLASIVPVDGDPTFPSELFASRADFSP